MNRDEGVFLLSPVSIAVGIVYFTQSAANIHTQNTQTVQITYKKYTKKQTKIL